MRLKEVSYAKKVGLAKFGSLGLSVVAEVESGDELKGICQELKKAVEDNINGLLNSEHPGSDNAKASQEVEGSASKDNSLKMTEAQTRFLFRLLAQQGIETEDALSLLLEEFGVESLSQVERSEASRKIEELLGKKEEGGNDGSF